MFKHYILRIKTNKTLQPINMHTTHIQTSKTQNNHLNTEQKF